MNEEPQRRIWKIYTGPSQTPIKHAGAFNPTLPFLMWLSFIPLGLPLLTAIWQCQAVDADAMGRKGHSFIPQYQAGIDFSLITAEHKRKGISGRHAKCCANCS